MRKLLVLIAAVAFVVAFTAPAFAAEWSFYGSARIQTWWKNADEDYGPTGDDDLDLDHTLQGNSRIGANVKAGDISGRFEYGTGVNLRLLYGEYDFGGWSLLIGQTYGPVNFFASNAVYGLGADDNMLATGGVYGGRNPMIRLKFGGFEIAALKPNTATCEDFEEDAISCEDGVIVCEDSGCVQDTDVVFPKLEAKYTFTMAGVALEVGGGWQSYDVVGLDEDGDEEEENINSYILYLGGKFNSGPFYFGGNVWMGKNTGNYGKYEAGADDAVLTCGDEDDDADVEDNDGFGWLAVVGFTMNDMIRFEGGYGFTTFDADFDDDDQTQAYYIQASINLGKGFFIVPEIGKVDYKDDSEGEDEGAFSYYGLKWQINF
jgi:hypothetical protein